MIHKDAKLDPLYYEHMTLPSSSGLFKHPQKTLQNGQANMDANTFSYLQQVMDELWFSQNILLCKTRTAFQPPLPPHLSTTSSSESLPGNSSTSQSRKRHAVHKDKKKRPVLNIVIGQPLFQLQHPSTPSLSADSAQKIRRRRKRKEMRSYKSLSDLENDELQGFMDLGFVFHKEKLSSEMICVIPGLQRLVEGNSESAEKKDTNEEQVKRPYLSESWLISEPDSPLLNLRMLPNSLERADMKRHLRFWQSSFLCSGFLKISFFR